MSEKNLLYRISFPAESRIGQILRPEITSDDQILVIGLDRRGEIIRQFPIGHITAVEPNSRRVTLLKSQTFENQPKIINGTYPQAIDHQQEFSRIVIKHLIHLEDAPTAENIISRAYDNLGKGGLMCITSPGFGFDIKTEKHIRILGLKPDIRYPTNPFSCYAFLIHRRN